MKKMIKVIEKEIEEEKAGLFDQPKKKKKADASDVRDKFKQSSNNSQSSGKKETLV